MACNEISAPGPPTLDCWPLHKPMLIDQMPLKGVLSTEIADRGAESVEQDQTVGMCRVILLYTFLEKIHGNQQLYSMVSVGWLVVLRFNANLIAKAESGLPLFLMVGWLVVLGFNATLIANVISWRSVTHMCFLAFSH